MTGWLVLRSNFMPRILGVFLMFGMWGLTFLSPPFALKYVAWMPLGSVGEVLLTLWLLVKGVDSEKWLAQASAARMAELTQSQVPIA